MNTPQPAFLRLPLELRQSIYSYCCTTPPTPNLLHINRQIHNEATQFIRFHLHKFNFHISAQSAGFDDAALWCFKVKRQKCEKNRMKELILSIHPPNRDKPVEMLRLWDRLLGFCKDLGNHRRIPGLRVVFVESKTARWATNGIINSSFGLQKYCTEDNVYRHDIGQILLLFSHLVHNVRRPAIRIPLSVINAIDSAEEVQEEIISTQQLMTGRWHSRTIRDQYEHLDDVIDIQRHEIHYNTGLASKAVFERMFGRQATLDWQSFQEFEADYPDMHIIGFGKRPRYRYFKCKDWYCGCQESFVEISMPPVGMDRGEQEGWYEEELVKSDYGPCPYGSARGYRSG